MISRICGLPKLRNDTTDTEKAATFSVSRMILEPSFSAAGGLSFEINWPISPKSATAGSVQTRVCHYFLSIGPYPWGHIRAALTDSGKQFKALQDNVNVQLFVVTDEAFRASSRSAVAISVVDFYLSRAPGWPSFKKSRGMTRFWRKSSKRFENISSVSRRSWNPARRALIVLVILVETRIEDEVAESPGHYLLIRNRL